MPISELCNREVVVIQKDEPVLEAARLMRQHHVGDVIIVEEQSGIKKPIGIVTDRDIVVEIMATELDPAVITVGDITVPKLVTVQENTGIFDVIQYMRRKAVRRSPVIDDRGELIGIITLDDLLQLLAEELSELATLAKREIEKEIKQRP
ncbi:MAG: CBS domain-containing protein [Burkholderiales bacterium]|nr:CBS domain-containing protein [Nitrosomonas sp.]MCP5276366.1 CBS domain-containing protein [Burkholderiales bacterium]